MVAETAEGAYTSELIVEAGRPLRKPWSDRLAEGYVDDSAAAPALAELRFRDPHHQLLTETSLKIGGPLKLFAKTAGTQARLPIFSGEIVAFEAEIDGTGTFTTVRALDHAHRLFRGRRVVAYRNKTAADIVREVARRARVTVGRIDPTPGVYELLAQANTTDWDFLRRLAEENDAELLVDDGKLSFRKATPAAGAPGVGTSARRSPFVLEYGVNLLSLRASVTSVDQVNAVRVRSWDERAKRGLVGTAQAVRSDELALGTTPAELTRPFARAELLSTEVPYRTQAEVNRAAKALAADITGSFAELDAVVRDAPQLRAGTPVTLAKVGRPFEGKYTVTNVRHVFEPGTGYRTHVRVSGRQDRSLYGLAAGGSAPARSARVNGHVTATVTDTKDPQQQGRVRLQFPWLSPDYVSDWARTVQMGGVRGGGVVSPEVGDEVLVGFEQGYLDRPYVIGGLYNGKDSPSPHQVRLVDRSGSVNRRSFATRRGHRLELLEVAGGAQGVRLATANGRNEIQLDQRTTKVVVRADGSVEITARRGITVDAGAGELTLTGATVRVAAKGVCMITGSLVRIN